MSDRFIPHGSQCQADDGRGPDFGCCHEPATAYVTHDGAERLVCDFHLKHHKTASSDDLLTRYVESEDRGERSVLFLRIYAAKIRAGTELTWEIPNTRASTVEQVANYLAELRASLTALSAEKENLKILLGREQRLQACDKCKRMVPRDFIAVEVQDGHPIDDPAGYMWCCVCHGQRVLADQSAQLAAVSSRLAQVTQMVTIWIANVSAVGEYKRGYREALEMALVALSAPEKREGPPT